MRLSEIQTVIQLRIAIAESKAHALALRCQEITGDITDRSLDFADSIKPHIIHSAQATYAVLAPIAWGILWLCCLTFHSGQAVADWWHSAPVKATDSTAAILAKYQDARLSSVVSIQ
jgi:hypothetical protein